MAASETQLLMKFITYSGLNKDNIASNLGQNDYSYFFVLQDYLPLLQQHGEVLVTDKLDEVDKMYAEVKAQGEDAVFLSFTPPHKTPMDMACPTIPVFAWEYSNIPNQQWGEDKRDDWSWALNELGRAITHSSYSLNTVKQDTSDELIIEAIPAPVWDGVAHIRQEKKTPRQKKQKLSLSAIVIDSRNYDISGDAVTPRLGSPATGNLNFTGKSWDGEPLAYNFNSGCESFLSGFLTPEHWGVWSRTQAPWMLLPCAVDGDVTVTIESRGYGSNANREIDVLLGDQKTRLKLTPGPNRCELNFSLQRPTNCLQFGDIDLTILPDSEDPRPLGIGLKSVEIRRADNPQGTGTTASAEANTSQAPTEILLDGVVYTSVFNPTDGRKDWESIVTAFCAALGSRSDATLILKITFNNLPAYLDEVYSLLALLPPFKCRILVVHGFLEDEDFENILRATSYVVNTSKCEGQCLPLMEFMSAGKPAISPDNTAMHDYIAKDNAFVVDSDVELTYWPHDPRQILQTLWYRVSWESIVEAYEQSYEVASKDPGKYAQMSDAAIESLRKFCSIGELSPRLARVLDGIADDNTDNGAAANPDIDQAQ
jgi:glycosyltransferase involved in cell wall biosynthesis